VDSVAVSIDNPFPILSVSLVLDSMEGVFCNGNGNGVNLLLDCANTVEKLMTEKSQQR